MKNRATLGVGGKALGPSLLLVVVAVLGAVLAGSQATQQKPSRVDGRFRRAEDISRTLRPAQPAPARPRYGSTYATWTDPPMTWRTSIGQGKSLLPSSGIHVPHIARRVCAAPPGPPPECGIYPEYDCDKARRAERHRVRNRRHGIVRATAHLPGPSPFQTPNLLCEVDV